MRTDGKAAKNKRIKKDALMSTAFDLFSSNGVNHTTISDITERAGLGKGTFYSYFKDKYDIRNHIIAHKSAQIFLKAKQAIEAQPEIRSMEDKIIGMSDNIIDQLTRDKPTLSFIYKNLSWGVFRNVSDHRTRQQHLLQLYPLQRTDADRRAEDISLSEYPGHHA